MQRFYRCLTLLCLFNFYIYSAFEPLPAGARINGMGMTALASSNDPFQSMLNPAMLGHCHSFSTGIHYTRLFGLKELSRATCIIEIGSPFGGFSLGGQTFGDLIYKETIMHLGWGHPISPSFCVGCLLNTGQLTIKDYHSTMAVWFDAGMLYSFSNSLTLGVAVSNANQARIGQARDPIPQTTGIGFAYTPVTGILIMLEAHKDVRFPLEIHGGLEVIPISCLMLRCGFIDNPQSISFGIGIQNGKIRIDYAFMFHPVLGATHHASVSFSMTPLLAASIFEKK